MESAMNFDAARANMVARQIRPWYVLAQPTLRALEKVPREYFVPEEYQACAFADMQIPLGEGEDDSDGAVMLEPKVGARMAEALRLAPTDRALHIGAGSGYVTALLATLCAHVTAVEIQPRLCAVAQRNLARANIVNVQLEEADAHAGWGAPGQFDAILVSGAIPKITPKFLSALNAGGRWVGIVGRTPTMEVMRVQKTARGDTRESLFDTQAPRLRNLQIPARFAF